MGMMMSKKTESRHNVHRYIRGSRHEGWRAQSAQGNGFWRQFSFGIPTWLWPLLICLVWIIQLAAH